MTEKFIYMSLSETEFVSLMRHLEWDRQTIASDAYWATTQGEEVTTVLARMTDQAERILDGPSQSHTRAATQTGGQAARLHDHRDE